MGNEITSFLSMLAAARTFAMRSTEDAQFKEFLAAASLNKAATSYFSFT